jgi:hypothetical protein
MSDQRATLLTSTVSTTDGFDALGTILLLPGAVVTFVSRIHWEIAHRLSPKPPAEQLLDARIDSNQRLVLLSLALSLLLLYWLCCLVASFSPDKTTSRVNVNANVIHCIIPQRQRVIVVSRPEETGRYN